MKIYAISLLISSVLTMSLSLAQESTKPTVFLDCYIPQGFPADCQTLKADFESTSKYEVVTRSESAQIIISLRQINEGRFTNLISTFENEDLDSKMIIRDAYIANLTTNEAYTLVKENLLKDTLFFTSLKGIENSPQVITFTRKSLQETPDDPNSKVKKYWLQPGVSSHISSGQGNKSFGLDGYMYGTYATPKIKLSGGGFFAYDKMSSQTTAFLPGINAKDRDITASIRFARTINTGSWSVAVKGYYRDIRSQFTYKDEFLNQDLHPFALNNQASQYSGSVGVEWILHPYQESDNGNFSIQGTVGPQLHRYIDPNLFRQLEEIYYITKLRVRLSKHFEKLDISGNLTIFTDLAKSGYKGINVGSNMDYRITNRINLNGSFNIGASQNWILSPAASSSSFQSLTSGNRDILIFHGRVGISFTIGNASLPNTDNRWD